METPTTVDGAQRPGLGRDRIPARQGPWDLRCLFFDEVSERMKNVALQGQPETDPAAWPNRNGAEVVPLLPGPARAGDVSVRGRYDAGEPLVLRRRLFERLSGAGRLTIVSGPAGSGKTWLLRSWIAEQGLGARAAWATVAHDEHDGQRFWRAVTDALEGIVEEEPLTALRSAAGSRGELLVERWLSAVKAIDKPALLVIDDLEELKSTTALAALERFVAHLPAHLKVVLITRMNPGVGLHRLRLAGAMTEVLAGDMRFTLSETRELLALSDVTLSEDGLADLHERTEGWAAGLRLATIGLVGHPEPERFVAEFCGSERRVTAFLQAEVLDRQPPEVRDLLLRTSVLERICGPLADALTGGSGSLRILQELEEANAFVKAVDVGRSWFRYHRLFGDLLQLELRRLQPALVVPLHRAAAQWFESNGHPVEAIHHAQSAGDWVHAARLLADHALELTLDGRSAEVRAMAAAFPRDAPAVDAELTLVVAAGLLADGLHEEAADQVAVAERLAETVPSDRRAGFDLSLAATSLRLACARGDIDGVPSAARSIEAALRTQPASKLRRTQTHAAAALVDLGLAEGWSLRLPESRRHLEQALELSRRVQRPPIEVACLAYLSLNATLSGRPASAGRPLAEQATSLVEACGCETQPSATAAFTVGGSALLWLGRLCDAERWLERAQGALAPGTEPALDLVLRHTWALLRLGQQRIDDAPTALREAERLHERLVGQHPLTLDLRARVLRTQVGLGETAAVRAVIDGMAEEERGRAEIRLAAAALELSEGRAQEAADELSPVLDGTAQARCYAWAATIEALLYDALARWELGDARAAEASLERALELAEPEGILLPFALVDVRELLERHRGHRTAHASLLTTILDMLAGSAPPSEAAPLLEPLSDAELRVVRYLPGNLKGPEIAAELCVSRNTIRTHLRHIYAKLDVHTRSEAVERARRLGLLAPA
jgi:LuxR family maltose regulon positive regulatory protein